MNVTIKVEFPDDEARALAQFVKRVGWYEIRQNAVSNEEAYLMQDAIEKIRKELANVGYSPR